MTKDVSEAFDRIPKYEMDMRNKRLKRAADLSLKHTYLPYELQDAHDPWADYCPPSLSPPSPGLRWCGAQLVRSPAACVACC